jgi:DHA1 family bicyclomycin/chloramphenicol resistance-like MFS transporter
MLGDFRRLLREPAFVGYAMHGGFSMAVFFSFLAAAPYVMITILERPPSEYGLMFILVSASFMAGNFLTARISRRIGIERMIVMGSIGTVIGTATILALVPVIALSPWALFLPMMLVAFSQGTAIPNALAAVVSIKPEIAGAASGLAGFMQMGIAAVAAQTIGSIQTGSPWPMAIGMSSCAALMLAFALFATHRR